MRDDKDRRLREKQRAAELEEDRLWDAAHGPRFEQLASWNLHEMERDFAAAMLRDGLEQETIVGLLLSNTLVAVVSASGFIGAQRMRTLYVIVGGFAGVASLVIGGLFIVGLGTVLPDLQQLLFGGGT